MSAPPRRPTTGWQADRIVFTVAVVALIATTAAAVAVGVRRIAGHRDGSSHSVSGRLPGATEGEFELVSGATTITIRTRELGTTGYRATTPDHAGIVPSAVQAGNRVQLHLSADPAGRAGPSAVEILLDRDVRWRIRVLAGASDELFDLRTGRISGIDIVGGVTRAEVSLPEPDGTVAVSMEGGASQLVLHLAGGPPVRVTAASGAGTVTVDGTGRSGVGAGTVITPEGWDASTDRYDIRAVGGVAQLAVDRH